VDKEAKLNQQQPSASTTKEFDAAEASARAREMFRGSYKRDPETAPEERCTELCIKAEGCEAARDFDNAIRYASEALALAKEFDPPSPILTNQLLFYNGKLLFYNERFEEAIKCYDKVLAFSPKSPEVLYFKGKTLACMNDMQGAVDCHNAAFSANPKSTCSVLGKAFVLCLQRKPDLALIMIEGLVLVQPPEDAQAWKNEILEASANAFYGLNKNEEALDVLNELDRERPGDVGTYAFRSELLRRLGRHGEELADIERTLEACPEDGEGRARHAVCLLNLKRTEEAKEALTTFHHPGYDPFFWECAVDFVCREEYSKSLPLLDYFDRSFPKEPNVKFVRAAALAGLGRYTEAASMLEMVSTMCEDMPAEASREAGDRCASLIRHLVERGNVECALQLENLVFKTPTDLDDMKRMSRRVNIYANPGSGRLRTSAKDIIENFPSYPYSSLSLENRSWFHRTPMDRFFGSESQAAAAEPKKAKPRKSEAQVAEEKRQKGITRAVMQREEARAELADSRNRLIETEMRLADAEKSEKESKHKLQQLAEKHSLRTWDDETRAVFLAKCERARKECAGLEAARKSLATELEGCEAAVGAYMREREIDEKDDSLLILHMRSNMRRGAQRDRLESSVERRRQARMQLRYYDGRVAEATAERVGVEIVANPLLEMDKMAAKASREAAALREKKNAIERTILSLKEKVGILEAKANGNGN